MKQNLSLITDNYNWDTPNDLYEKLNAEFHFTLDPCSTEKNHKTELWFSKEQDGLQQNWGGQRVFCNPPYGRQVGKWVKKAYEESLKPETIVVMLVFAKTDTKWFHDYIQYRAEVRFVKGRLKFGDGKGAAPYPSMIVIFRAAGM